MAVKKITETDFITGSEMTEQDPDGFVEYKGKFYRITMTELGALVGMDRTTQVHEFVQQWIEEHPDDVIMLKDGSISLAKLTSDLLSYLASETELDVERKRIDSLIAGGEITGNFDAEIVDARTQWNGTVASSLGSAIRDQFNAIFTNLVAVQTEEPTASENKVWIKESDDEYTVPTVEEMNAVKTALENAISEETTRAKTAENTNSTNLENLGLSVVDGALCYTFEEE